MKNLQRALGSIRFFTTKVALDSWTDVAKKVGQENGMLYDMEGN